MPDPNITPDSFMAGQQPPPSALTPDSFMAQQQGAARPRTWMDEVTNTVGHWWNQVNPLAAGNSIVNAVAHPIQAAQSMGRGMDAPRIAAEEAFKKGDYAGGVRHALNYALNALPGVGSTLDTAGNEMEQGDISGGLGDTAGLATNLLAPKLVPAVARGIGKIGGAVKALATDPDILPNAGELATGVISPHAGVAAYARRQVGRMAAPRSAAVPKVAPATTTPPVPLEEVKPFQFGPDDLAAVPDPDLIKPVPPKPPMVSGGGASPTWTYSTTSPPPPVRPTRVRATANPAPATPITKVNGAPSPPITSTPATVNQAPAPTPTATPASVPPTPPPGVSVPAAKLNIMTEPTFKNFAASNGLSEADAAELVKQQGYEVMPRGKLNQLVHNYGIGHSTLSDIASMKFGVKSMKDLTDEQMLQMGQELAESTATGATGSGLRATAPPPTAMPSPKPAATVAPQTSASQAAMPEMSRGGIVRPRFKVRARGSRPRMMPQTMPAMTAAPVEQQIAPPQPVSDLVAPSDPDAPIQLAKGGVIATHEERVRGSIDVPLAPKGIKDANELGDWFAKHGGIDQIVSSSLTRARQTAAILKEHNPRTPVAPTKALSSIHYGSLEGQPQKQARPIVEDYIRHKPDQPFPGVSPFSGHPGESFNTRKNQFFSIVQPAMRDFLRNPNSIIVLVVHRSGISIMHGWAATGAPPDGRVDADHVTAEREQYPVMRWAPAKRGKWQFTPVDMTKSGRNRPGIYFVEHTATELNSPDSDLKEVKGIS